MIIDNYGVRCLAIAGDVSKEDKVDEMVSLIDNVNPVSVTASFVWLDGAPLMAGSVSTTVKVKERPS